MPAGYQFRDIATMLHAVELDGLIVLTSGSRVALAALQHGVPGVCDTPAHLRPPPDDVDPATLSAFRQRTSLLEVEAVGAAAGMLGWVYSGILLESVVHELAVRSGDPRRADAIDRVGHLAVADVRGGRAQLGSARARRSAVPAGLPRYREDVRFHRSAA